MGAAIWGKKARVKNGRRKAPAHSIRGNAHNIPPFIINSTKKVKGVWRRETPPFLYFTHPKKAKKKATANNTKGRCGNEFRMTL